MAREIFWRDPDGAAAALAEAEAGAAPLLLAWRQLIEERAAFERERRAAGWTFAFLYALWFAGFLWLSCYGAQLRTELDRQGQAYAERQGR